MVQLVRILRTYSLISAVLGPLYWHSLFLSADLCTATPSIQSILVAIDSGRNVVWHRTPKALRLYQLVYHTIMQDMQTMIPAQPRLEEPSLLYQACYIINGKPGFKASNRLSGSDYSIVILTCKVLFLLFADLFCAYVCSPLHRARLHGVAPSDPYFGESDQAHSCLNL